MADADGSQETGGSGSGEDQKDSGEGGSGGSQSGSKEGGSGGSQSGSKEGISGESQPDSAEGIQQIYVQVAGAVSQPGVYQLPADSRVFMAVELAGGLTPEADSASLNQAEPLSDGQMIYVAAQGESPREGPSTAADAAASDGRVNLNTATAEELMTLPGIGASKAEMIISYREGNGGFQAPEDIMKIEGIKEGVFSKIKDRVKVK